MAYRNVQELHRAIVRDGGATVSVDLQDKPTKGYMVSLRGMEVQVPLRHFTVVDILTYFKDHWAVLDGGCTFFGAWVDEHAESDPDKSIVYLDVSANITDRQLAFELAKINGQLAVYDVEADDVLYLNNHEG